MNPENAVEFAQAFLALETAKNEKLVAEGKYLQAKNRFQEAEERIGGKIKFKPSEKKMN